MQLQWTKIWPKMEELPELDVDPSLLEVGFRALLGVDAPPRHAETLAGFGALPQHAASRFSSVAHRMEYVRGQAGGCRKSADM